MASGAHSDFKIDCASLGEDDWSTLALMLKRIIPVEFKEVLGVPTGGFQLANAMQKYVVADAPYTLVVDDVYTTGGSIRKFIKQYDVQAPIWIAVVFSRHKIDHTALFTMG